MSFLDRFQGKIATVTAQGHLRKADGSEEIRVGPPKRKPQPVKSKPISNNSSNNSGSARSPQIELSRATKGGNESARGGHGDNNNRREEMDYSYGQTTMPGQLSDDYTYTPETRPSKLPSPTLARDKSSPRSVGQSSSQQSPKDRNEALIKTEQDQLAFSRKARPVSYEPCKLSQYKKEKPGGYYELGKLQPDLNSDELVQKRANMERIKAFSKNLRDINKTTTKKQGENNEGVSPKKPQSTRDKALEFAKRVPKPKAHRAATPEEDAAPAPQHTAAPPEPKLKPVIKPVSRTAFTTKAARPINSVIDDDSEDDDLSSELQQLQQRHQLSRAQVDALIGSG